MNYIDFYCHGEKLPLRADILSTEISEILSLEEILAKDNVWWEDCHNHIQWVFPTNKRSQFNDKAPRLSEYEAEAIRLLGDDLFTKSVSRFLNFLRATDMSVMNHNHLRITRCIESTALILGEGEAFNVHQKIIHLIKPWYDEKVLEFWNRAVYHDFL